MTNVNKRIFDELAEVLKSNRVGNALILQIADVCARANPNFHRDWFTECAGYEGITPKSKVLKLGSKMKVIPMSQLHDQLPSLDEAEVNAMRPLSDGDRIVHPDELDPDWRQRPPVGWDQIEAGEELEAKQEFAKALLAGSIKIEDEINVTLTRAELDALIGACHTADDESQLDAVGQAVWLKLCTIVVPPKEE